MTRFGLALLLLSIAVPVLVCAQEGAAPLDEAQFWSLMRQTDALLQQALGQADASAAREQALQLWQDVHRVQPGDMVIEVDMRWITEPLANGDTDALRALQRQVRALLDYQARLVPATRDSGASLPALDEVLRDPRFQYAEVTPTPIPPQMPDVQVPVSSGLSQFLLIAAGLAGAIAVFLYFARSLQVQPAALDARAADEEPTTSASAIELAASYAAARDYRSAIRYLYLSSLLMLDERSLIHYDSTLTNREHLRQVRSQPQLHDLLRRVVNVFEDVWYGYAPVDETFYQQYVQHIDRLRQFVP